MKHADLDQGIVNRLPTSAGGGLNNVVEDLTPQLGGNLDPNGFAWAGHLVPSADDTYNLGTLSTAEWSNLYLGPNAVIGFDNNDVTITHVAGSNFLWFGGGLIGIYHDPSSASTPVFQASHNYDSAVVKVASFRGAGRATAANGDEAHIQFGLENSAGSQVEIAKLTWQIDTVTAGAEDGRMEMNLLDNGVDQRMYVFARDYLYMNHTDLYFEQYGSTANNISIRDRSFNKAFELDPIASSVNNVRVSNAVTGTSPTISGAGDDANVGLILDAKGTEYIRFADAAVPNTNDGAALGTTALKWSDLWLAADAKIDFNSGGIIWQHDSANDAISFSGGIHNFFSIVNTTPAIWSSNYDDSNNVAAALFLGYRATPTDNDRAYMSLQLSDDTAVQTEMARIVWRMEDVSNGTEDGSIEFYIISNGSLNQYHRFGAGYYDLDGDIWYTTTSPEIRDLNYNELIDFDYVASAVNHISIENAVTTGTPSIKAVGDDTNVNLGLAAKGTGLLDFQDAFKMTNVITPAQITANQDNYAPTGYETASVIRLTTNGYYTISGLAGGVDGKIVILVNANSSSDGIDLLHDTTSTAANRFYTPSNGNYGHYLYPGSAVTLYYDGTSSRWIVIGGAPRSAENQSTMETATNNVSYVTPNAMKWHPGVAKCWVVGTPNSTTIIASYNVTALGDTATGQQTVTIATDFSSANYCVLVTVDDTSTTLVNSATVRGRAPGSYIMNSVIEAGSGDDPSTAWHSVAFGDQ